ncbi:Lnb N-terminal periplasmic domain-containing protein [Jiella pelagia]|uniref:DUF4105 domain-containing protein n=1 Tax=Jiella pelagia TaxID=2986949 RepID=A0ABY7BYJ4_9HYPH|nr:DUF4105 domain-containing protein [Jiella pelagia]WAP67735.1 DUF4105 domain-containing protein [Jiella pelagia]
MIHIAQWLALGLLALVALILSAWSAMALWYQAGGSSAGHLALAAAWLVALAFAASLGPRHPKLCLAATFALVVGFCAWWWSIEPRGDREWATDVEHIVTARREGRIVTLENVRDFVWSSRDDYVAQWKMEEYDLAELASVDVILSYWGIDAIAHTLVSFGFSNGRHVVFSVEIRREWNEEFSSLAGFFKSYELALIAATERDILFLRTNVRGEDVYLYPVAIPQEAMQTLFMEYAKAGNDLARQPAFYDTLTANCTTVVFDLARMIEPGLPTDWRILLSGYLPGYLRDQGVLPWNGSISELRQRAAISRKSESALPDEDYSRAVRAGQ